MTRYHATSNGNVPFTSQEEAEWDTMGTEWAAGADNRAAIEVRNTRDRLLAATDFYALPDVTMSDAMETYRQALRNVPAQSGFPNTITWPEAP
tara:strand:- start:36 stop:314 length:279 start_codon:yes stop_codon:yes gene_type:complete